MKIKLLYLLPAVILSQATAQTTVIWSDSIVVASSPQAITAPRVTLLDDGTPLLSWGLSSSSGSQIWCSRYENGALSTPVGVTTAGQTPSLFGFGGYDVAAAGDRVFIVFEQLQHGIFLTRSDDGGRSFGLATIVQPTPASLSAILASVAADAEGNPLVSYIYNEVTPLCYVRRSQDGGLSFTPPAVANLQAFGFAVSECCSSDLSVSGDSVWTVFRNNNANLRDIWVSRSTNHGATFDVATDVDATEWITDKCPITLPRIARSGDSLITLWMSGADGTEHMYLSTAHAATMQFGQQLRFPHPFVTTNAQGQVDICASGDTVAAVIVENNLDILFYHGIGSLQQMLQQSGRIAVPDHVVRYPSIAFRDGVFHLVYVDATTKKVLYRRGWLMLSSGTTKPSRQAAKVFPNPVPGGRFTVEMPDGQGFDLVLFDIFGRKCLERHCDAPILNVEAGALPKGVYFLQVLREGEMLVTRTLTMD